MDSQNIDFEAWAKMLISRKVPEDSARYINSDVIRSGAELLRQGQGFEVHLLDSEIAPGFGAAGLSRNRITVTPFPQPSYHR